MVIDDADSLFFFIRSIRNINFLIPQKTEFYRELIFFYFLIFYQPVYGYRWRLFRIFRYQVSSYRVIFAQLGERRGTLIFPFKTMGKFKLWGISSISKHLIVYMFKLFLKGGPLIKDFYDNIVFKNKLIDRE